ncbi:MAG: M16 family metallopeptidase [Rhizomicrobium sp.]
MARRLWPAFVALLCAAVASGAASAVNVKTLRAPRGEEVWYVSDHTLPMIAMSVALPAGSAYDPPGKFGLATFAASLLDEGAGGLNSSAFQTALANRAIRLSVSPGRDCLVISMVTLTDNARDAFRLLGLALSRPRFDADAIARVRAQILTSLAQEDEDPASVAAKGFFRAYFHDHPYAHPVSGDAAGISAINQADLKAFATDHWVRGDLRVAVSGDIDPATLATLLNSAFGRLPARTPPPVPWVGHVGQKGIQIIAMAVPQPTTVFGMPGLLRSDRDFIPAYVANYILGGGGFSSRLTNEVREKRGLTYDISTSLYAFRRAGVVIGEFATKQGSVRQAIAVTRDTLKDFSANGPTDKELADAKTFLTGSFPLGFGSNVGIASELNAFQQDGLPVDYVQKRNGYIDAVTIDDVKRVAKRLFNPGAMTVVIGGNPDMPAKAGAAAHR